MQLTIDILGWAGAVLVLVAYFLVSARRVRPDSPAYQGLNIAGGALLLVNAGYEGAYPSSFVNLVWIGIGCYALCRHGRSLPPAASSP
jgi:hypothetical protein